MLTPTALWRHLARGLRALVNRNATDRDAADEIAHYIDQTTAANIARGIPAAEARRLAHLDVGNATNVREQMTEFGWEETVRGMFAATNLRTAFRGFARSPGFTATALLTLAVCLGANLTIFAVIDSVLLRPLPFPESDRLVAIYNTYPKAGVDRDGSSVANYYERRGGAVPSLESVALSYERTAIVGDGGTTERTDVMYITPEFFATLGVSPARGRPFTDRELESGADRVAIVSDGYWRDRLGADSAIVGKTIRVEGAPRTVVGVLPRGFTFLSSNARLYFPRASAAAERNSLHRHSGSNSEMIARLRPGASIADAQREIDAQNARLEQHDPEATMMADAGFRSVVAPLHADHVASVRPVLLILQAAVLALVLIGTVNLATLVSIRASAHSREMTIRRSLGATRIQVMALVVAETLVLTLAGAALGVLVGTAGMRLVGVLGIDRLPLGAHVTLDGRAVAFTVGVAIVIGLVVALPAAWHHLRGDASVALRGESRGGTANAPANRLRGFFLVAQVALAFTLLSGSMLLGASLARAMRTSPGFQASRAIAGRLGLPGTTYGTRASIVAFADRLTRTLRAQPGVVAAGLATNIPFSGNTIKSAVTVRDFVPRAGEPGHGHYTYGVTADYLEALGVSLREGRLLTATDMTGGRRACVVDEDFARRYWPSGGALGKLVFRGSERQADDSGFTIVGVVGAVKQADVTEAQAQGAVYFPLWAQLDRMLFVVARTAQPAAAFGATMSTLVRSLDPDLPLAQVQSMEARVDDALVTRRSPALLAGLFAGVALLLAAIGTYGVLGYAVAQRRREIGVRIALGAPPRAIGRQFLSRGMRQLGVGLALGLAGAWAAGRLLQRVLFGVGPMDPAVLATAAAVIAVVALGASVIPAWRASKVDPLIVLSGD